MENTITAKTVRLSIINKGDYIGTFYIGSQKTPCTLLLDTGSSTLAISNKAYDPRNDANAKNTHLYQHANYGSGSWNGNVVKTNVNLQNTGDDLNLENVNVAVAIHQQNMFNENDGILGLAYQPLNTGISKIGQDGYLEPTEGGESIEPYFTQLEKAGIVANKFAFYTLRSTPDVTNKDLNNGFLILGGGEEEKDLFTGDFKTATVTHDQYYNVNLKNIWVGNQPKIAVPAATNTNSPNCIVDSGTNGLVFPASAYKKILSQFDAIDPKLGNIIDTALNQHEYDQSQLNLADWPSINVELEGPDGDIMLEIKPDNYWQLNSGNGVATLRFFGANAPAILGLPLMNNYYCVFDRSGGNGVIKFADVKK